MDVSGTHKKRDLRLDMGQKSSKAEGNPFVKSQKKKKRKKKKGKRMITSKMILSQALLMASR